VSYRPKDVRKTTLLADRAHQLLKRTQRRLLLADYEDLRLRSKWLREDPDAPFDLQTIPVRPDPATVRSVLVFKPDEIGDGVYALPAVAELRRAFEGARFSLLCHPLTAPLYERSGLFDQIAAYSPGHRALPVARRRLRDALSRLSDRPFDLAVFLRTGPATFRDFLRVPAAARLHPLDPRLRSESVYRAPVSTWTDNRRHMSLQLLEIVAFVTGRDYDFADVVQPPLQWQDEDRAAVDELFGGPPPQRYFVLHPFAKDETRRYPPAYWPELLDRLDPELATTWVSVGGPGDGQMQERPNLVQAQGRLALGATGFLLSRASGFIGNLSGPAHLAGALGIPTATLMSGHSLPAEWAPLGNSLVVRADVPCAPCHQRTCPVYGLACLTSLEPQRIAPELARFFRANLRAVS
jgi:ADP-heptose:LPS heptosyltransferase